MGAYFSSRAASDLANIVDYIAASSPQNADEFITRIAKALERITKWPRAPRVREELPIPGLRIVRTPPCLLIYRVLENDDAEIIRVAHDRQDFYALLGGEATDD